VVIESVAAILKFYLEIFREMFGRVSRLPGLMHC